MKTIPQYLEGMQGKVWTATDTAFIRKFLPDGFDQDPTTPPVERKVKITEAGQPCRHCQTPVVRDEHVKPPKYKRGGYYFTWWLKCPNCRALYMQESAKRMFE